MNSARKGPMSRDRPQAAAERSEDRVRRVAKPAALDSGPSALCVGQEAASNAEATRTGRRHLHATHAQRRRWRHANEAAAKRAPPPQRQEPTTAEAGGLAGDRRAGTATSRTRAVFRGHLSSSDHRARRGQASPLCTPRAGRAEASYRQRRHGRTRRRLARFGRRAHCSKSESTAASNFVLPGRTTGRGAAKADREDGERTKTTSDVSDRPMTPSPTCHARSKPRATNLRTGRNRCKRSRRENGRQTATPRDADDCSVPSSAAARLEGASQKLQFTHQTDHVWARATDNLYIAASVCGA